MKAVRAEDTLSTDERTRLLARTRGFQSALDHFERNREALLRSHADRWIAVLADGATVVASDHDGLLREMERLGLDPTAAVIEFMSSKPQTFIL